jgi:hypothetical protein
MCARVADEGEETLDRVEWGRVLAQGEKVVGATALLGWCGTGVADTHGIALA